MSGKPSSFERSWRILEYLRRNTDAEHPERGLSALLKDRRALKLVSYIRQKDTFMEHGQRPEQRRRRAYIASRSVEAGV